MDQLADLLLRWRGTTGTFSRGRIVAEGARLIAGLTTEDRRVLARALAEQGAPGLADHLDHLSGRPMGSRQVRVVANGLLALEDHQLDGLLVSLRDGESRRILGSELLTDAFRTIDEGFLPEGAHRRRLDALPPPGPPATSGPAAEPRTETATARVSEPMADPAPEEDVRSPRTVEPRADDDGFGHPHAMAAVSDPDPTDPDPTDPDPTDPDPTDPGLLEDVRAARTATQRLRRLRTSALRDLDPDTAVALLEAVPAGWQRRRAAERLVAAGSFPTDDLERVLDRLGRSADVTFVAGALTTSGQVAADRFDGLLPERTLRRLTARSGR